MKVQTVSKTGAGSSSAVVMNTNVTPFNVGFAVIVTGTVAYSVQHTFDDPASGFSTWFTHPTVFDQAENQDGNYAFPVTGVRVTVHSGGGTATLKIIQAGI
jgi:hypothetical protein